MKKSTEAILNTITACLFAATIVLIFIDPLRAIAPALLFIGTSTDLALWRNNKC